MFHTKKIATALVSVAVLSLPLAIQAQESKPAKRSAPTVAEAEKFLKDAEARLEKLANAAGRAAWVYETHITDDTEAIAAQASELALAAAGEIAIQARRYNKLALPADSKRKLKLLQLSMSLSNDKDREAYTQLSAQMNGAYGKATYCKTPGDSSTCLNLGQLENILAKSRNPAELKDAWLGWHAQAATYKDRYVKYVDISNKGSREMGFANTGANARPIEVASPPASDSEGMRS